jgi:hypothetical protein
VPGSPKHGSRRKHPLQRYRDGTTVDLGNLLREQGKTAEAEQRYRKAAAIPARKADGLQPLGWRSSASRGVPVVAPGTDTNRVIQRVITRFKALDLRSATYSPGTSAAAAEPRRALHPDRPAPAGLAALPQLRRELG